MRRTQLNMLLEEYQKDTEEKHEKIKFKIFKLIHSVFVAIHKMNNQI